MLEILVIMTLFVGIPWILMAKRPRRRWTAADANVPFQAENVLGTLGNQTADIGAMVDASDNEYRAISIRATWAMNGFTAGEGPLSVGYAHGDYTATEVKEFIEAGGAMTQNDKIAAEQANRLIRLVGVFSGVGGSESLNDGKPIRTRLNWRIADGGTINQFVYNHGGAALTTGAAIVQNGALRLRWL